MKTRYQSLCQLQLQHRYYSNGSASHDFSMQPTPACQRILDQHNILFRQSNNGISLYVAVIPETDPAELFQELHIETLKLSFWLEITNPLLFNILALPAEYQLGKEVFYFDNLTEYPQGRSDDDPLYLNGSESEALGIKLQLITNSVYTVKFEPKVTETTLTLKDQFENDIETIHINEPSGIAEYRINLADISGLVAAGRYTLSDSQGHFNYFYFDPELIGKSAFGLIELYSTTKNLTPDNSEKVPASYQFLSATNTLTQISAYQLKFDSRETIWRYIVTQKYQNTGLDLSKLSVKYENDSRVSFNKTSINNQITFTASKALPLTEANQPVALQQEGKKDIILPNPTPSTTLQKLSELASFSSDVYVYV